MSSISTKVKRLFVRNVYWEAQDTGDSLFNVLKAAAQARLSTIQGGRVLISTSGNGKTATYTVPGDFTATDAAELVSEILDRYDEAKAKLISDGTANPTDTQIYNELMEKLECIKNVSSDFWGLRSLPSSASS